MVKVKKWIKSRIKKPEAEYDEAKREFEMAMGKPFISIKVEIPKGFEDLRAQFLNLEKDKDFLMEVEDLVKKWLVYEKRGVKRIS
ncbi:MAG: hypothetical protein OEY24_04065 [Candidatus Bathyarchaeota archaeon]|nr:hypothetical protein [Candidatus Bathyarchaeota archaeon]MDH5494859.1 hypothetical protein [Candidatus Bathyarchaeota archaeon]